MNKIKFTIASLLSLLANQSFADDVLTGRTRLSCEAILCLSTGSPPSECSPSLNEYFSIDYDDFSDTLRARIDFLNLCPVSSQTPQMRSLVNAIANGAGRCDAASLNTSLMRYITIPTTNSSGMGGGQQTISCIVGQKPSYCAAYENHEYTDINVSAHYVAYRTYNAAQSAFGIGNSYGATQQVTCGHWVN